MRSRAVLLAGTGLPLLIIGTASAHVTLDKASVPANSDQTLQARVPGERPPAYTTKLIMEIPKGFTAKSCQTPIGWSCVLTPDTREQRNGIITWKRESGANALDLLSFVVRTPAKDGAYAFQADQFYSDGVEIQWDGPEGAEHPAPVVEVTGAGTAPVKNTAAPAAHHTTASSAAPSASVAPAATSDSSASPLTTPSEVASLEPSTVATASTAATAEPLTLTAADPASSAPSAAPAASTKDDDGGVPVLPVTLAVLVVAGAGGAVAYRIKSR